MERDELRWRCESISVLIQSTGFVKEVAALRGTFFYYYFNAGILHVLLRAFLVTPRGIFSLTATSLLFQLESASAYCTCA